MAYQRRPNWNVSFNQPRADGSTDQIVLVSQTPLFLGVDPAATTQPQRKQMMHDRGFEGPKVLYLSHLPATMNQTFRGYFKRLQPGEAL
jgi:hypothetical protein